MAFVIRSYKPQDYSQLIRLYKRPELYGEQFSC